MNEQPALVLHDVLPYRPHDGVFSLAWPLNAGLIQLRGRVRPLPAASSPLERAEEFFARGEFREALPLYDEHSRNTDKADSLQKSRRQADCKAALCLLHMNRVEEAMHLLQQTYGEGRTSDEPWPALAGLTLWKTYLEQERFTEAESLFDSLAARYPLGLKSPFASLVSENDAKKIYEIILARTRSKFNLMKAALHSGIVSQLEKLLGSS